MKHIGLSRGYVTLVDDADFLWLNEHKWSTFKTKDGKLYACRASKVGDTWGAYTLMHRVILELEMGDRRQVDHKNGNGLDNQRYNIRVATPQENAWNKRGVCGSNLKGAYKQGKRWRAKICVNGKQVHLGYFDTAEEAKQAYLRAAFKYFGEFASGEHIKCEQT